MRPLFHARTANGFFFASELKSILAEPTECVPYLETLDQVFTFWLALAPRTMIKGVSELPPGDSIIVTDGSVRVERYWQLDYSAIDPAMDEDQCADEVLALLDDATRLRLRWTFRWAPT